MIYSFEKQDNRPKTELLYTKLHVPKLRLHSITLSCPSWSHILTALVDVESKVSPTGIT